MWFKVDDNLAFHPKSMRAGTPPMGLWVRAGSWCAQQLTDGYVPEDIARALDVQRRVVIQPGGLAEALVDAGLWLPVEGGYQFHQWGEEGRQPSRHEVEARRESDRKRKAEARAERARKRAESGGSPS